ncbi:hypothetical protein PR202_gb04034 [Eleusine coracana subsp. coracana]|uniref:Uncharacterized protein n=1 Tax=Eleusine coracana subsp. coracana TaxID=191504 RepID=A0AAV5E2T6_ELECO|nr:hypothetical protein PR202_gb04034 [Eleusine coracana subsp. coracana]
MARNPGCTVYIGNFDEKIAGHDKPISNGSQPVIPKLNPIPLPKQSQSVHCSDVTVSHTPAYPGIARHDKPTSSCSQPVIPKLNPIPLPKQSQFMHCSNMTVYHTPAYPGVNGTIPGYGSSPNLSLYGIQPQALSGGPVHSQGQLSNGMHDYNRHAFGSAPNVGYGGPVLNVLPQGAVQQPIMYPSY